MNPRAFVVESAQVQQTIVLTEAQGHHFARVLRVRPGEELPIAADNGAFLGEVKDVDSKQGSVSVFIRSRLPSHEARTPVYLVQGLAKGDKIDDIIQRCTEVGLAGILVLAADRSVAVLSGDKIQSRLVRWRKIAMEAASQSQRDFIPTVDYAGTWAEALQWMDERAPHAAFLLDEAEDGSTLVAGIQSKSSEERISVILGVGPEGGWTNNERDRWQEDLQAVSVTLGPRIMRTETAGVVGLTLVLREFGAFGGE